MQNSIKNSSKVRYTVPDNAAALKSGALKASHLPTIRVWKDRSGKIWTLDHRGLASFMLAGLDIVLVQFVCNNVVKG